MQNFVGYSIFSSLLYDHPHNKCLGYNAKPSEIEAPVQELLEIWSTTPLPLLPGPLWPGVVVPVSVSSIGQIELFDHLRYVKPFNCV